MMFRVLRVAAIVPLKTGCLETRLYQEFVIVGQKMVGVYPFLKYYCQMTVYMIVLTALTEGA